MNIENQIESAKALYKQARTKEAWAVANKLAFLHSEDLGVRMLRGFLSTMDSNYSDAVAEYSRAIAIAPLEPHLFFERGINRLEISQFSKAEEDFTEGLRLCDLHNHDYYRSTLHFFRAEARLELGKKREARVDLNLVPEDFTFWTHKGLRTRIQLLSDCAV